MFYHHYNQLDAMDCGPTCLRMIARHYGRSYSLQNLRERCHITREGVSMLGMSDAAEGIGFRATGVKITWEQLRDEMPLPCIVHWNQRHFVVVYEIRKRRGYAALNDVAAAEGQCQLSRMELCQLLEIQDWEGFAIEPIEADDYDGMQLFPSTDSVSVESRPEYRSAEAGVEVARRNLQIARSSYYPTLSLSAGYGTSYSGARQKAVQNPDGTYRYEAYPFFRQYLDNGSSYISLSLNIPIFSGMSTRNSVRRARNASMDAQYALQTVRKQLSREYEQALIEYQTSCRQYDTAREQLAYAEEAARMMTEKYNLGKTDFTSWNTAMTELAKAKYAMGTMRYSMYLYLGMIKTIVLGTPNTLKY